MNGSSLGSFTSICCSISPKHVLICPPWRTPVLGVRIWEASSPLLDQGRGCHCHTGLHKPALGKPLFQILTACRVLRFGGSGQLGLLHLLQCSADLQGLVENTDSFQTSEKKKPATVVKRICIWKILPGYTSRCNTWDISA